MDRLTTIWGELTGRLRSLWESQSRTNRIVGGGVLAVILIGLIAGMSLWLRKPDYGVLFSNLAPEDSASVVQKLKDDKVDYQLGDGGTTIKVPMDKLYEERVQLAGAGVVKGGGTGFELFDKTNLGMTDFQEKIAKTRAIEGELQRTIDGLAPVQSARVHIAQPEASLYSSTQQPTTASIAISTRPGANLNPDEIRGITALVANAVEGLKPENVTIVDQNGNILLPRAQPGTTAEAEANALRITQDQLVAKQRYEANLQQSIQSMLDQTLGPKKAAARVAVEMNFDANQQDNKTYAPQGTVRSEQVERESYNGTTPAQPKPQGVPGTTTNIVGTYQGVQQPQQNGRYNKSKATRNYEITESTTKHVDAPGKVTRTSVAVLVNVPAAAAQPVVAGNATQTAYEVNAADVAKIRNVVVAAAGLDLNRGDQVSVEAVPFNPAVTGTTIAGRTVTTFLGIPVAALGALGLVLLLAGAGAAFVLLRRRSEFRPGEELPTFDSSLAEELPPFQEHPMLEGAPGLAAPIRSAADLTREQMIEYVTTVAQENPESIAKLVKLWLAE